MGLIKLAVLGGVAFWAGQKYNQKHQEGGCHRNRRWGQPPDFDRDMNNTDQSYPYHTNEKGTTQQDSYNQPPWQHSHQRDQKPRDAQQMIKYTDNEDSPAPPMYGYRRSSMQYTEQPQQMKFVKPEQPYSIEQPVYK